MTPALDSGVLAWVLLAVLAMPRTVRVDRVHHDNIPLVLNPQAIGELTELLCVARPISKVEREPVS